ncbi:B12-binding domain-containing radical SAM protein [Lutispora saccharofermentans]|uniref:B12-binding domain-containing radical SAM protein n=1 Tax=Lutispora saccharofermentans TaxID=3024236 RepID=A0ABT1NE81_9FIRM|nr:B12-binding domain-containing radical SAM protein [Lutispora saccharofermentans]MCQ1528151.1 B12-binding domain-containing radical SAM protein [Lutispora saccharofermentans]
MDIQKLSLIALNSKFIHSNLAVRYLSSYLQKKNIKAYILEFSINDSFDSIIKKIYLSNSDVIAFSCYIWNRELVMKLGPSLKKVMPDSIIVLGGPEASYDVESTMKENPWIDYIISGEGEETLYEFASCLKSGHEAAQSIDGLACNKNGIIRINKPRNPIYDLDRLPFPYDSFNGLENKILYYETSRGCPFKCQYCLSSLEPGVRYFSLEKVYNDIDLFIENHVRQVKLVDRTFNCSKERCLKIMDYILSKKGNTNFHFEISGKLIDSDFLDMVRRAPKGIFQFEIGVQSTNDDTLETISRMESFESIKYNIIKLIDIGNCHVHLDLIAGLPCEDIKSFEKSFNDVYYLRPHMLQLGFLKLLRGSGLRQDADKYGILYNAHPPYEVLSTKEISYKDILELKVIEELVEIFHNSARFSKSLSYLIEEHNIKPFQFFKALGAYYADNDGFSRTLKISDHYELLYGFASKTIGSSCLFNELLKFDYFKSIGANMPACIQRFNSAAIKGRVTSFLKNEENIASHMPELISMDVRQKLKYIRFEIFDADMLGGLNQGKHILFSIKDPKGSAEDRLMSFPLDEFMKISM